MVEISIITPAYNSEEFISKTIESVISQTFVDWEMIIVNDGSEDGTELKILDYSNRDKRIKYIKQPNQGEAKARWEGIKASKGKYIYLLDSDDIAFSNGLETLYNRMEADKNIDVLYGKYCRINKSGEMIFPNGKDLNNLYKKSSKSFIEQILKSSFIAVGAFLIKRDIIKEDDVVVNTNYSEDWIMLVNLAMRGNFSFINKNIVKRRVYAGSQTQNNFSISEQLKSVDVVYENENLKNLFSPEKLHELRNYRIAFCYFSIACKQYAAKNYDVAEKYIQESMKIAYRKHFKVWVLYFFIKARFMPNFIFKHFGLS